MAGSFRFKQFTVANERSAMKVGTDGVLLGAWVKMRDDDLEILDVGTGTGVIALMLAQRSVSTGSRISAIDIDPISVEEAASNFSNSPWRERLEAGWLDFREMEGGRFDLIVSNPPYFVNSLKAPEQRRSIARHTDSLSYDELVGSAVRNLAPEGRLAVILPAQESVSFIGEAVRRGLAITRKTLVRTTENHPPKRILIEASSGECSVEEETVLTIQDSAGFTAPYKELTRDFYLKF